jgi:hypothetical protein
VNTVAVNGGTPLHYAAYSGNAQCCGALMGAGALIDARDCDGETPLMVAQHCHPANAALHSLLSGIVPAHAPGTTCDLCGTPEHAERRLKSCKDCLAARYCNEACSALAWPSHKEECRRLKAEREHRTTVMNVVPPC